MTQYYSPNFHLLDLIRTILHRNSEKKLRGNFQKLTGKRYVLFTSSCRTALYLAYQSLGVKGVVHTSPLTCKVALQPIVAAGNQIAFSDVRSEDWTLNPISIESEFSDESVAIQAIHLGGYPCDMPKLREIADKNNLALIEDCAQGFGSKFKDTEAGSIGDISCFTLSKNLFGLGGGVFVTDNIEYYERAKRVQDSFSKESYKRVVFRVVMALLASKREGRLYDSLYLSVKDKVKDKKSEPETDFTEELKRVPKIYLKSVSSRWEKINELNQKRVRVAEQIKEEMEKAGFIFQQNRESTPSYTKLFCYSEKIDSAEFIKKANLSGIEFMHLEHKHRVYYQDKQVGNFNADSITEKMPNVKKLYSRIVSPPLYEGINSSEIVRINKIMEKIDE